MTIMSGVGPATSLGQLLGYRVDSVEGRIGTVEGVTGLSGLPGSATLVVSRGLFVRTRTALPFASVAEIAPESRRIVVHDQRAAG